MCSARPNVPDSLRLDDVGHVYDTDRRTVALESVDLTLGSGEMVVVCGSSGSGKTTLMLAAAALLSPTKGHVFWGRRDVAGMSDRELSGLRAETVGVALQAADLVETLTALENVALPQVVIGGADAFAHGRLALESLGIEQLASAFPHELSAGERRRVAIARALSAGRAFVLVDEPTAYLDQESSTLVADALRDATHRGVGVLAMAHDTALAQQANRSYLLMQGQLREC